MRTAFTSCKRLKPGCTRWRDTIRTCFSSLRTIWSSRWGWKRCRIWCWVIFTSAGRSFTTSRTRLKPRTAIRRSRRWRFIWRASRREAFRWIKMMGNIVLMSGRGNTRSRLRWQRMKGGRRPRFCRRVTMSRLKISRCWMWILRGRLFRSAGRWNFWRMLRRSRFRTLFWACYRRRTRRSCKKFRLRRLKKVLILWMFYRGNILLKLRIQIFVLMRIRLCWSWIMIRISQI